MEAGGGVGEMEVWVFIYSVEYLYMFMYMDCWLSKRVGCGLGETANVVSILHLRRPRPNPIAM